MEYCKSQIYVVKRFSRSLKNEHEIAWKIAFQLNLIHKKAHKFAFLFSSSFFLRRTSKLLERSAMQAEL